MLPWWHNDGRPTSAGDLSRPGRTTKVSISLDRADVKAPRRRARKLYASTGSRGMIGLTFDTGALIALERLRAVFRNVRVLGV